MADKNSRIINFRLPGDTKHISVLETIGDKVGPFVVAYDGLGLLSIQNVVDVNAPVQTIDTNKEKITSIDYAGRFTVNGKVTDVLVATGERKILLYDLNNRVNIPINNTLQIKTTISDLVVINGVVYLALGNGGIVGVSVGSLINTNDEKSPKVAEFRKNKLKLIKSDGRVITKSRLLNAKKLANANPFLLVTGENNNLTVIKVLP